MHFRRMLGALVAGALLAKASASASDPAEGEAIEFVTRVRNAGGVVRCGLFDGSGWLKSPRQSATSTIAGDSARCTFRQVKPGIYAVSAFHDANANGKLDTNFFGIPVEDYCTSRNARGVLGPPSFDDAKFIYRGATLRLEARMQ